MPLLLLPQGLLAESAAVFAFLLCGTLCINAVQENFKAFTGNRLVTNTHILYIFKRCDAVLHGGITHLACYLYLKFIKPMTFH